MSGDKLQGTRRDNMSPHLFEIGDYGKWRDGWYGLCPSGDLCNLSNHAITENQDKSITVHPSILVGLAKDIWNWHGYLIDGVWIEC
jgi:hypothetical protein